MAIHYFEQDFDYDFYPLKSDRVDYEVLPASPVSVYVYDERPTEADAAAGTGALATIAAWSDTPDGKGKRIAVPAITEPTDYTGGKVNYYIVVNTALTNPIPPIIKTIKMTRLTAQESIIDVSVSDVLAMEPTLHLFCNKRGLDVGEIEGYVDAAITEVKFKLTDCDLDFASLNNPGQLNLAIIYLAISKFFLGQSRDMNDIFWGQGLRYKEQFDEAMKGTHVELDTDGDGETDQKRSTPGAFHSIRLRR